MRRLVQLTATVAICMCSTGVLAEPVYSPSGKPLVMSLENKAGSSMAAAQLVAVGKIVLSRQKPALEPFSKGEAFARVGLAVSDVLKGDASLRGKTIELKMPVVMPGAAGAPLSNAQIQSAAQSLQKLERNHEAGKLDERAYKSELQATQSKLVQSPGYLQQFILVPLRIGGLDTTRRATAVLLQPSESYVVMILKDLATDTAGQPLFPWELDVYVASDAQQMNAVRKGQL